MADYRVDLDIFAGPMDLLLYLVRKDEVDIYDIPIAKVTDQYIQYTEMIKRLDMDLAGDFLVMAATLMEIKSAMLLPRVETEEEGNVDPDDPRSALVRQLLEYKKFKDAANLLDAAGDRQGERFNRPGNLIAGLTTGPAEAQLDLEQVSVWDLLEAFDALCRATGRLQNISSIKDDTPIDLYQIEILDRLQSQGGLTFRRLLEHSANRLAMVGQFLALLELIRWKLVRAEQPEDRSDLFLIALSDEPAAEAVNRVIQAQDEELAENVPEGPAEADEPSTAPIPIAELPAKRNKSQTVESLHHTHSGPDASASEIGD